MHSSVAHFLAGVVLGAVAGAGGLASLLWLLLARVTGLTVRDVVRHWRG